MLPIKFYKLTASPPCRTVLLTAKQLGIDFTTEEVNIMTGEQKTPDYLKMNPAHSIPTMDDNGFYLWESRAIIRYLADQYAQDDKLYPKDIKERAIVDQMMFFDANTLYISLLNFFSGTLWRGTLPEPQAEEKMHERISILDTILSKSPYVAGQHLTIADITLLVTITTLEAVDVNYEKYTNVYRWTTKLKSEVIGYQEINQPGLDIFTNFFHTKRDEILKK